jgi:SLOG family YspA-like protein
MPVRVIVTGSRDWTDYEAVFNTLNRVYVFAWTDDPDFSLVVVQGGANGADAAARVWVDFTRAQGYQVELETWDANWDAHGKTAGPIRNKAMIDAGATEVLAFINRCTSPTCNRRGVHGSHGASNCVKLAKEAGIPVVLHFNYGD